MEPTENESDEYQKHEKSDAAQEQGVLGHGGATNEKGQEHQSEGNGDPKAGHDQP